ncbi:MAG: mitomycin antibiotics/polyketide fumonisin biosynthesis protein [Nonomuraea sp.]|nr:mitomycin antibiotics/polyketide fumonisin biosynthesis protein [Nonomuraea sp.]NUP77247.1 mitomycin antibiotics/polyketide fumonisin biosynthesis protein [Nonomuraea sp.]NUS02960.1 mitomycin antibiotics/polyketide fumonisin biosynthesis protein [Nonomuraea sp.]NUT39802.1 mitomycin antibiotics/polyketide fumonisin biosynthesis protein [Thermoactinospora sp.]
MGLVDLDRFVDEGFVKLEAAVPREVGDAARALLWQRIGLSPDDPSGWKQPVVWAADLTGEGPFGECSSSPRLRQALDEVAGPGGWAPRLGIGNMPIRFPGVEPADDRGWHIDASVGKPDGTWLVSGRPETLLLLVLLSDVGPDDAPTRIRVGSHRDASQLLGDRELDPFEAGPLLDAASKDRPLAYATGQPGDMYLVHPLTVHAADEHRGTEPRFMAQTPVFLTAPVVPGEGNALARALLT